MASCSFKINEYINKRYSNWLDYARYHCKMSGIQNEEYDVLDEVLLSLLEKEEEKILRLLNQEKDGYTGLDWFVIRMINRNITSSSSPYRRKRICLNVDRNIDYTKLNIEDLQEEEEDRSGEIYKKMNKVRNTLETLELSQKAKQIFYFRFFCGENFKNWEGGESIVKLYDVYNNVSSMVKEKVNNKTLF